MGQFKVTYKCPDWGLHGAPTQKRDRSHGITHAKTYAQAEGLSDYGPGMQKTGWDKLKEMFKSHPKSQTQKVEPSVYQPINKNERELEKYLEK